MFAIQALEQIQDHAKTVVLSDLIQVPSLVPCKGFSAQGDVNITRLSEIPIGATKIKTVAQVAPGTSRGSRHCIRQSDLANITTYRLANPNPLQGNILDAKKSWILEHPEHKHQEFEAGIYFITYQRRHADELRRSQD